MPSTATDKIVRERRLSRGREEFRRLYRAGRLAEARALAERELLKGRELLAWVHNLASVAMEQGSLREAYSLYVSHARLLDAPGDHGDYEVANFHLSYGITCKRLGAAHGDAELLDRALVQYAGAAAHFELAGEPAYAGYAENCAAAVHVALGRPDLAYPCIDRAQLLFNDLGDAARVGQAEHTRATALRAEGRHDEALEACARSARWLEGRGERLALAETWRLAGEVAAERLALLRAEAAAEA